jgi:hypothetical protein
MYLNEKSLIKFSINCILIKDFYLFIYLFYLLVFFYYALYH